MKVEMEGREPLVLLFGLPVLTTGIVFASMYFGQSRAQVAPVVIENKQPVNAHVQAEVLMPQGSVQIRNEVPPPQALERSVEAPATARPNVRPALPDAPQKPELPSTPVRAETPAPPSEEPARGNPKALPARTPSGTKPVVGPLEPGSSEPAAPVTPESEGRLLPPPKPKPEKR